MYENAFIAKMVVRQNALLLQKELNIIAIDWNIVHFVGYGKTVCHVVIGLKTAKGTKQLKLDPSIYESLQKEKVETGDVIYIESNSGAVKVSINHSMVLIKIAIIQNCFTVLLHLPKNETTV